MHACIVTRAIDAIVAPVPAGQPHLRQHLGAAGVGARARRHPRAVRRQRGKRRKAAGLCAVDGLLLFQHAAGGGAAVRQAASRQADSAAAVAVFGMAPKGAALWRQTVSRPIKGVNVDAAGSSLRSGAHNELDLRTATGRRILAKRQPLGALWHVSSSFDGQIPPCINRYSILFWQHCCML